MTCKYVLFYSFTVIMQNISGTSYVCSEHKITQNVSSPFTTPCWRCQEQHIPISSMRSSILVKHTQFNINQWLSKYHNTQQLDCAELLRNLITSCATSTFSVVPSVPSCCKSELFGCVTCAPKWRRGCKRSRRVELRSCAA